MSENKRSLLIIGALLCGTGFLMADRNAQDPNGGVRYVDVDKCFDAYGQIASQVELLNIEFKGKYEAMQAREAALGQAEGELAIMDPSSVEFVEKRFSLQSEQLTIERDRKFLNELLARRRMELMYNSYVAVQRAASELAAREGFGAVIVVPRELPPQPIDLVGAIDSLKSNSVLWTNPNYDVTEQVIEILNGGG